MADDPVDELFAAPLDEFVTTRNRIASELRKSGAKDEAERVKAMRKPPAVVWALNTLARRDANAVHELLEAAGDVRAVQSGRSNASFADTQRAFADTAWRLAKEAAGLLAEGGRKPSDAIVQRLGRALTAAAASPETSELLRAGRLEDEPETLGFGGIGEVVERPAKRGAGKEAGKAERERREAEKKAAERERLQEAQRELREAKAEAARLSREAERAQERVVRLEKAVARLRRE